MISSLDTFILEDLSVYKYCIDSKMTRRPPLFLKRLGTKEYLESVHTLIMNLFMFMHGKHGCLIILLINTLGFDMKIGNPMPWINSNSLNLR